MKEEKNKNQKDNQNDLMEKIVSLCKRRGFVFQGSEIYGGMAGMYDYGPYGVELLNNIKAAWWKEHVQKRDNYFGLDSAMFKDPHVWEASGHTSGFSDPLAECKKCNTRIRVDKELEKVGIKADEKMSEKELDKLFNENKIKIKCPKCGANDFTSVRAFNLLVKTNMGDFTGKNENPAYLPGEACQGIYLNFKNVVDSTRAKIPFGIAQIGKAFRNEINTKNSKTTKNQKWVLLHVLFILEINLFFIRIKYSRILTFQHFYLYLTQVVPVFRDAIVPLYPL